jgi:uncharacterized protein YjiK
LLVVDSEVEKLPGFTGENVFEVSLSGTLLDAFSTIPFSNEPNGVAYNPNNNHLYISDDDWKRIFELNPGLDGLYFTGDDILTWFSTSAFDCVDPEGVAFDNHRVHLFLACGNDGHIEWPERVYDVAPGPNGIFDGVSPSGDDQVSHFDLGPLGVKGPEGIEYNPDYYSLLILSEVDEIIAETTLTGSMIRIINIAPMGAISPAGLAYAPASDDPSHRHLYIADRGLDNGSGPDFNDGKLFEVAVPPRPYFKIFLPFSTR